MTLKNKIDEIFNSTDFGEINVKYGKKIDLNVSYYTGLMFGEIPDKLWSKEVKDFSCTGQKGRVDYCIVLK